jgi:fumarate hydratase subunit alpha
MPVTYDLIKRVSGELFEMSLKRIPRDTLDALQSALNLEKNITARKNLSWMIQSARAADKDKELVCADSGVPEYFISWGTGISIDWDIKKAVSHGYYERIEAISPPVLPHITNPLTLKRGYRGKDVPLLTIDLIPGADYVEIICSPKGLGSGQWADLQVFSFPSLETIEGYVMDCVIRAGSQPCPPVVIGVGIGGDFDNAARMAKEALLRPIGSRAADPFLQSMEERLLKAVNETGIGPMGTGGDTTALAVHVCYASGHGFTPVAVGFNCWVNRKMGAKVFHTGKVVYQD